MKKYFFILTLALFSIAPFAQAATISSNGTPLTPLPFAAYCAPYTFGFESGKHYLPQQNGSCTYALPILGAVTVGIYKGVPGNAQPVTKNDYFDGARLIHASPNDFSGIANDQDLFSVIYDQTLDQGNGSFDTYLKSGGTIPAGAIQNTNYFLVQWKWGPKPASEFDPVVVIPGILGSWQKDSGPVIDPIFKMYQNLTDTLLANGYSATPGPTQTLYTFPYNWENSNITTAGLLEQKIAEIKTNCSCSHVDIVAHGMGGLIAWNYIESANYQSNRDIDQLIFLGTPFDGVPEAYRVWEGGEVHFGSPLMDALGQVFLAQEATDTAEMSVFNYIHNRPVLSFEEILPIVTYLFNVGSYPTGHPQNSFIENLHSAFGVHLWSDVRINNVLADDQNFQTTIGFFVGPPNPPGSPWQHGQPTATFTDAGDDFVPRANIENSVSVNQEFDFVSHQQLPSAASSYVFNVLNNRPASPVVNNSYPVNSILFIALSSPAADMKIIGPGGELLGKDFVGNIELNTFPDAFYTGFGVPNEYAIIVNPPAGAYVVEAGGTANGTYQVVTNFISADSTVGATITGTVSAEQIAADVLNLSTTTPGVILSPAVTPPSIVIASPANNHTYFTTDTIPIIATITNTFPITTTTYLLNNVQITPAQSLSFPFSPLGTSTLFISAQDSLGNIGSAQTIFGIIKAPLTVTAENKTMTIGGPLPALTATTTGFRNGETLAGSGVTGTPNCTTTVTTQSPVGNYSITCSVGTLASSKYSFTFVAGILTVGYRCDGFIDPINNHGHESHDKDVRDGEDDRHEKEDISNNPSVFKGGSTVPVKFQFLSGAGMVIQATTSPLWLTPRKGSLMSAPVDESLFTDPETTGLAYQLDGSKYKFNWKTKGLTTGYWYRVYAKLGNGQLCFTTVGLR